MNGVSGNVKVDDISQLSQNGIHNSYSSRRRVFEVDGHPLEHWKKDNFEPKRDATCRVVYEPKEGKQFFHKTLNHEDYDVMRGLTNTLEQPYFSKYNRFFPQSGHFCCKACGNPLYSYQTKFDIDDGWPAFGACILGAVGITTAEERASQIEKEDNACIKIQSLVRGIQCRNRVEMMLDELIQEMLKRRNGETQALSTAGTKQKEDSDHSEPSTSEKVKGTSTGYVLSRALGDTYAEIHCHRCKSHLGDVFAQLNTGNNDELFREHHRVNGRSIKYMQRNLPKRTEVYASLLFADQSQRRRLGLPDSSHHSTSDASDNDSSDPLVSRVHGSIPRRWASDPLGRMSYHEKRSFAPPSNNRGNRRHRPTDPLSVTTHANFNSNSDHKFVRSSIPKRDTRSNGTCKPPKAKDSLSHISDAVLNQRKAHGSVTLTAPRRHKSDCTNTSLDSRSIHSGSISSIINRWQPPPGREHRKKSVDPLGSISCHERMMTPSDTVSTNRRRRPMSRGNTISRINIEERKAFLEEALDVSFH